MSDKGLNKAFDRTVTSRPATSNQVIRQAVTTACRDDGAEVVQMSEVQVQRCRMEEAQTWRCRGSAKVIPRWWIVMGGCVDLASKGQGPLPGCWHSYNLMWTQLEEQG